MTKDEVLRIFRETGALIQGHFILRSGLLSLAVEAFESDKLPPDLAAIPPAKPGSK